jgi:hypothetical protein
MALKIIPLPPATISPALNASEYALVVAALRLLEDDMRDGFEMPDALKIADEAVALRAKLRTYADRRGRPADIIALPVVRG